MPEPIDYRNPRHDRSKDTYIVPLKGEPPKPPPEPAVVVPVEFAAPVIRSEDYAAVQAIEVAVRHKRIASFRREVTLNPLTHVLELFVRAIDSPAALQIADRVLATREKFKSYPAQPSLPDEPERDSGSLVD